MPTRSLELSREWLGEQHTITQALSQGVAPHHGRIPNVVREAIELDCRAGRYRVIVATNTLAQGVNLPVRTVIMHSTWRSDEEGGSFKDSSPRLLEYSRGAQEGRVWKPRD